MSFYLCAISNQEKKSMRREIHLFLFFRVSQMMRTYMPLRLLAVFIRTFGSFLFDGCYFASEASFGLRLLSDKINFVHFAFPLEPE